MKTLVISSPAKPEERRSPLIYSLRDACRTKAADTQRVHANRKMKREFQRCRSNISFSYAS